MARPPRGGESRGGHTRGQPHKRSSRDCQEIRDATIVTLPSARSLVASLAFACALGSNGLALADEHPVWDLQFGAGIASMPDYIGASASGARLRVWVDGAYRTANLGTFSIDSGSLT